ncbi:hypothetical protein L1049_024096 [Liquidambar formosana]|uniref:Uncharacterized protein n=1 Tax=Liquidambar formosana TaxID=63359 RepID=A0AAP0S1D7_LIQFO
MEIKNALENVYKNSNDAWLNDDLYATAFRFRLLRQHGFNVSQDVFERFKDETGKFKTLLREDVKGLLSLYEASFFGLEGETTMDEAKAFTTTHLKDLKGNIPASLSRKVGHALDMPVHWRLTRVEARWFIDTYKQEPDMNPTLLELARLDYNIVQSIHRREVSKLARSISSVTQWADLCKAYLKEARWFHAGYKPTLEEYLDNAVVSIAAPLMLFSSYFLTTDKITKEALDYIDKLPSIMRCSSMLLRLTNDLGTSSGCMRHGSIQVVEEEVLVQKPSIPRSYNC